MKTRYPVAYCRTSTAKQDISIEAQQEAVRAYCKIHGMAEPEIIIDRDEFSGNLRRPGVRRILELAESGNISAVIIYKLDRMTRSVRDAILLVDLFNKHDVAFVSVMESLDTKSPMGMFFVQMMAAIAELERKTISQRTKAALRHMKNTGFAAGHAPFGSIRPPKKDGKRQPLQENPQELEILRAAHSFRLAGMSLDQVAEELTLGGYRTRTGSKWTKQYVSRILRIPPPNNILPIAI